MRALLRPDILYAFPYNLRRDVYSILKRKKYKRLQQKRLIETDDGYTYKPYDDNQCIFVHVPKTAGMSISRALFGNLSGGHATLADYQIIFGEQEFNRYFKFSFVRNPWDRIFSAYNFLVKGGATEYDRLWAHNIEKYGTFQDFVKHGLRTPEVSNKLHFLPQSHFLTVPHRENSRVDFLGFFENIKDDFDYIRNKLNLNDIAELKHVNATPGSEKKDFRDYYDNDTKKIVQEIYSDDIKRFGYSFDNSSLPSQLKNRSS